jgi:hypothetical protein
MGHFKDESIKQGIDPAKSRKGANARQRGHAFEREVAKHLNAQRVGQFGGKQDVANDWIAVQCKVGGSFSERQWDWLQSVPVKGDQLRGLVIGDSPGLGGGRRRVMVILDMDDFKNWFVPQAKESE